MKLTILFAIAISLSLPVLAQDAMSTWTAAPVTVDGSPNEWPAFFRFYAPGTRFQFDVMNDKSSLYLCVRVTEMEAQGRIMHSGLTIWVDASGKKKQKTGISFPQKMDRTAGNSAGDDAAVRNQDPGSRTSLRNRVSRLREAVLFGQSTIKPIGLPGLEGQVLPLANANGLNVAYSWDSLNILFVEYQIPLSLILGHAPTAADLDKPLGLGLVAGGIENDRPKGGAAPDNSAGMNTNRGMGGRPGAMTGQGQTMGGATYDPNKTDQKTWLKLHLESK